MRQCQLAGGGAWEFDSLHFGNTEPHMGRSGHRGQRPQLPPASLGHHAPACALSPWAVVGEQTFLRLASVVAASSSCACISAQVKSPGNLAGAVFPGRPPRPAGLGRRPGCVTPTAPSCSGRHRARACAGAAPGELTVSFSFTAFICFGEGTQECGIEGTEIDPSVWKVGLMEASDCPIFLSGGR